MVIFFATNLFAQSYDEQVEAYINQYKDVAIAEMQRTGIPASITLGQGIIESGAGKSPLATVANNHFGIKCHEDWRGETFTYDDDKKNEYNTNIQIVELNALNASLAVIKWKKLCGFYNDLEKEYNTTYSINVSQLLNDETTA